MERQSIARDIHDGPVQTLSSLLFNLQLLREATPDLALQVEVDRVKSHIKSTVQELRQIMYELRPPSVVQFGISKAIQSYTENLREHHTSITWHLDLINDHPLLSQQICLTLFRSKVNIEPFQRDFTARPKSRTNLIVGIMTTGHCPSASPDIQYIRYGEYISW